MEDVPESMDIDPYKVLGIPDTADETTIKQAYRRLALRYHPDKVTDDDKKETAKEKFQQIAFAYGILSDTRRRKLYDSTGSTSEVLAEVGDDFDWLEFYRDLFQNVTTEQIEDFSVRYKGSVEERKDILQAYADHRGNMKKIWQSIMLSDPVSDDERFHKIIDDAIVAGELKNYPEYQENNNPEQRARRVTAEVKRRAKEAKHIEAARSKIEERSASRAANSKAAAKSDKHAGMQGLMAAIQSKQGRAESFFESLEKRFVKEGSKKGSKKRVVDEPPEEAFEATARRQKSRRV